MIFIMLKKYKTYFALILKSRKKIEILLFKTYYERKN